MKKLPITLSSKDSVTMTICFHPLQPAVYSSSIIWNTDIDPSLCGINRETDLHGIAVQKSSVKNPLGKIHFSIHPNPVSGNSITITFPENAIQNMSLAIYDVLGKEIYKSQIPDGILEYEAHVGKLSDGVYYVRMASEGEVATEKFVKTSEP